MSAGNNQVRYLRRLGLRSLANFEDVVVEKADDIHRAKHHGLPVCLQGEATNIEVVMNSSRNSVMAEAGNVNLAFMSIWRNDRFSRSGPELCLSLSKTERQRDHRKGNDLGKSSQVNRTALSFHPAPKQKTIRMPDAHAKGRSSLEESKCPLTRGRF
jgi:hypothetical protein